MGNEELREIAKDSGVIIEMLKDEIANTRRENKFQLRAIVVLTAFIIIVLTGMSFFIQWRTEKQAETHQRILADFMSQYEFVEEWDVTQDFDASDGGV